MPLIKWTPFIEPFEEMEKFMASSASGLAPAVDVYETKNEVIVEAPLAGVDPNDLAIAIEADVLTLKGEMKKESEVDEKNYYRKEVRSGSFFRSVGLPAHVLADQAQAESHQGLLKITIPKAPGGQSKRVKVKVIKAKKSN